MWLTQDGRLNTASLPSDASPALSDLRKMLAMCSTRELNALDTELEALASVTVDEVDAEFSFEQEVEAEYVGAVIPEEQLRPLELACGHAGDLVTSLSRIPARWRLDAVVNVQQLIADIDAG